MSDNTAKRVMVVASTGGHWVQLLRIRPAWSGHDVTYVSTDPGQSATIAKIDPDARFFATIDANLKAKGRLTVQAMQVLILLVRVRPDVIISTGASVGFFALWLGRKFKAKTIWIDSMANAEELSSSGQRVRRHTDLWLTQWEHLATYNGPEFKGSVF